MLKEVVRVHKKSRSVWVDFDRAAYLEFGGYGACREKLASLQIIQTTGVDAFAIGPCDASIFWHVQFRRVDILLHQSLLVIEHLLGVECFRFARGRKGLAIA